MKSNYLKVLEPYIFLVTFFIFNSTFSQLETKEQDPVKNIRERYDNYWFATNNSKKLNVETKSYANHLETKTKQTIRQFKKLDLTFRFNEIYTLGRSAKHKKTIEDKKDITLIKTLINSTFGALPIAYATPGINGNSNTFYKSKEIEEILINSLEYMYSRGFKKGFYIERKELGPRKDNQADFTTYQLRLSGYCQTIMVLKEELKKRGLYSKYLDILKYIADPKIIHRFYGTSRLEYFLNSDGLRNAIDRIIPYALTLDDSKLALEQFSLLKKIMDSSMTIRSDWSDTIKPDGSPYHHLGIYASAYTTGFINEVGTALYFLQNTKFMPSDQSIQNFASILESMAPLVETVPFGLRGRMPETSFAASKAIHGYLAASNVNHKALVNVKNTYKYLEKLDKLPAIGTRSKPLRGLGFLELQDNLVDFKGSTVSAGQKHYTYGGLFLKQTENWTAAVKGFNKNFWDYEASNTENVFGQQMNYGVLNIFKRTKNRFVDKENGVDFKNGWDWYRMPGATAMHLPIVKRKKRLPHRSFSKKEILGSASIKNAAVFGFELQEIPFEEQATKPLTATKSYFFFKNRIIAIGTNINKQENIASLPVETTIFQTLNKNGIALINDKQIKQENVTLKLSSDNWLEDTVGNMYFIPKSKTKTLLKLSHKTQDSRDHSNRKETNGEYTTAWLDHSALPKNQDYEYLVYPFPKETITKKEKKKIKKSYTVISKNKKLHAVKDNISGASAYIFYTPFDNIKAKNGQVISSDKPIAIVTNKINNTLSVGISSANLGLTTPSEHFTFGQLVKIRYRDQVIPNTVVKIAIKGSWKLTEASKNNIIVLDNKDDKTYLQFELTNGMVENYNLIQINNL